MPERIVLLVNPVAGAGRGIADWPAVERVLTTRAPVTRMEPLGEHALIAAARGCGR